MVPASSVPPAAQTPPLSFCPSVYKGIIFRPSSLLAPFPPPSVGNGRRCPRLASPLGSSRTSQTGPVSMPGWGANLLGSRQTSSTPPPAPLPPPRVPPPRGTARAAGGIGGKARERAAELAAGTPPLPPPVPAGCRRERAPQAGPSASRHAPPAALRGRAPPRAREGSGCACAPSPAGGTGCRRPRRACRWAVGAGLGLLRCPSVRPSACPCRQPRAAPPRPATPHPAPPSSGCSTPERAGESGGQRNSSPQGVGRVVPRVGSPCEGSSGWGLFEGSGGFRVRKPMEPTGYACGRTVRQPRVPRSARARTVMSLFSLRDVTPEQLVNELGDVYGAGWKYFWG